MPADAVPVPLPELGSEPIGELDFTDFSGIGLDYLGLGYDLIFGNPQGSLKLNGSGFSSVAVFMKVIL